eukprot:s2726_g1.t1
MEPSQKSHGVSCKGLGDWVPKKMQKIQCELWVKNRLQVGHGRGLSQGVETHLTWCLPLWRTGRAYRHDQSSGLTDNRAATNFKAQSQNTGGCNHEE